MTISELTKELQKNKVTAEVYITNEEGNKNYTIKEIYHSKNLEFVTITVEEEK